MRPLLLLIVFFSYSFFTPVYSQQVPAQPKSDDYSNFMKKRKNNVVAGWILLGGGVAMSLAGAATNLKYNLFDTNETDDNKGLWMVYVGVGSILGSIPCFVAASTNKNKALTIKNQPTATLQPMKFRALPSLTLEIGF